MNIQESPSNPEQAAMLARGNEIGTAMPTGSDTVVVMSGLETTEGEPRVGNVLRRTCMTVGERACAGVCQLAALRGEGVVADATQEMVDAGVDPREVLEDDPTACADNNLNRMFESLGVAPEEALMVGVTADKVGFLDDETIREQIKQNPHGWGEVAGYNAFFMREGETLPQSGRSAKLLGVRLADSGYVTIEMKDRDGRQVVGVVHSTRTNMPGREFRKEYEGEQQSFMHHVLTKAMDHYGASAEDITLRVAAAVGPKAWAKRYPNARVLKENLPGWAEEGLIENKTNPNWRPGMEVFNAQTGEYDELWPNYPAKVIGEVREAADALGIANVITDDPLNPGEPRGGIIHSSANRPRTNSEYGRGQLPDSRDAYAVVLTGSK